MLRASNSTPKQHLLPTGAPLAAIAHEFLRTATISPRQQRQ